MREIKFRAWDTTLKRLIPKPRWQTCYNDVNSILMQYTGLKDKNGKEIYEGDIVKSNDHSIWVVKWDCDYASFMIQSFGNRGLSWLMHITPEVIGNIYENPELVGEGEVVE